MNENRWFSDKIAPKRQFLHSIIGEIYSENTEFQKVDIIKSEAFGKMLILDNDLQSAEFDEYIYHETMVHPAMLTHPDPRKVLIIGGGEGATLREVVKYRDLEKVVMVDIDKRLIEICKEYLPEWSDKAFEDKRLTQVFSDAKEYLINCQEKFDVIISDLTEPTPDSPSRFLMTREFFDLIKSGLSHYGIFTIQASMISPKDNFLHSLIYKTLLSSYKIVRSSGVFIPSYCNRWGFIVSSDNSDPLLIKEDELQRLIDTRLKVPLKFYDYEAHKSIFALYKPIKIALEQQKCILTNNDTTPLNTYYQK